MRSRLAIFPVLAICFSRYILNKKPSPDLVNYPKFDQMRLITVIFFTGLAFSSISQTPPSEKSVKALTAEAKQSLVTVIHGGRGNTQEGTGTGFAISRDMIATCLHVIGEARPIHVRTAKGEKLEVLSVYSSDRKLDLAILKIKNGDLKPLPLGNSNTITQGDPIIALGNPMGLTSSVVQGVLSARREMELGTMLQLAIPVEPGNSGGPLLDGAGHVVGIVTARLGRKFEKKFKAVPQNINFAVKSAVLEQLLRKKNIQYQSDYSKERLTTPDIVEAARRFTALVECWESLHK